MTLCERRIERVQTALGEVQRHLDQIKQGDGVLQGSFLYESATNLRTYVSELHSLLVDEWAKKGKKGGRK
jgi:hypothetical protein